jgi:3-hydroxymyristoyl/3-hydroxydecanoyl-(acyl carrier protein) dehydratase
MRFLFVDRIIESASPQFIRGIKHITCDDFYLTNDGQGRAYFIPSLIGETLGQLAAWNVMQHNQFTLRPVAGVVACAQLHHPAYVGDTLLLESFIDSIDDQAVQYHSTARVGDTLVFTVEGALGPLLSMADFIDLPLIKRQFNEIYHPGDWDALTVANSLAQANNKPVATPNLGSICAPMMFDRVLSSLPGKSLVAEKRITRAAPYLADHFPNKPVLPMTVLLECKLNLAYQFIREAQYDTVYQVSEFRKIKMNEFVLPGDVLVCQVKIKHHTTEQLILTYRSEVNGKRVCVVDVVLIPKGN